MWVFDASIATGLTGLALLAIPGLGRHRHGHVRSQAPSRGSRLRFVPSPRAALATLAVWGAAGRLLSHALSPQLSALIAALPAVAIEVWLLGPISRATYRFAGHEQRPLEAL